MPAVLVATLPAILRKPILGHVTSIEASRSLYRIAGLRNSDLLTRKRPLCLILHTHQHHCHHHSSPNSLSSQNKPMEKFLKINFIESNLYMRNWIQLKYSIWVLTDVYVRWNRRHSQYTEHCHHPLQNFSCPFPVRPSLPLSPGNSWFVLLSLCGGLHFLELYVSWIARACAFVSGFFHSL